MELHGLRVTIMGLGHHGGGVAAARFCAQAGAMVTVTDLADEQSLAKSLNQLCDVPIANFTLCEHREKDFREADIVIVNPAVRPDHHFVEIARMAGAKISSEIELFLDACPAMVIGVTGTVGKSTTAAMLAAILQTAGSRTWLGGNIGHSLLADLPQMQPDDIVVLELSSFQLHWLSDETKWPRGAIVTNCSPNHLDWHGRWEDYVGAKQRLLTHLTIDGIAVVNSEDVEVACWRKLCGGASSRPRRVENLPPLRVPGDHNRQNAACAARMAKELGVDDAIAVQALAEVKGLPHRLCFVAEIAGRRFYNDSKSTSPAATIAALNTMDRPTWLLLGGADAKADFTDLAQAVVHTANASAVFGAVADKIQTALHAQVPNFRSSRATNLLEALAWCVAQSAPGDTILLSPACPSTDQFRDFAHRGEEFERLVAEMRD
jgi:UDP-N-acetylmuramoylalanine--D-glutamate ligase